MAKMISRIDMTAASFVHILEPHWNPKLEEQAIGRVHRIGQSRNVLVTRYLVENSIEDVRNSKPRMNAPIY
jgi:SNF2 family DNA or RNA helicase